MLLDFILGNMAKNVFTWIRKKRGMKPLHEIASEISREQVELEQIRSEQEYARFEGRDDKENLYEIAKQQEKQTQDLTKLTSDVKMVKFILILLVVFYVAYTFLK